MDDKFLYQLQEQPDAEFANSLHRKLNQIQTGQNREANTILDAFTRSKKLVQAAAFLVIILVAAISFTPVRAYLAALVAEIGGQFFEVTDDYPGDNHPGGENIVSPQIISLDDALAAFPHEFQMPSNIPAGYVLNKDQVRAFVGEEGGVFSNLIQIEWIANHQSRLFLIVTNRAPSIGEVVAPESTEEIVLDGEHTAVLIRGGWDADNKVWRYDTGVRLRWVVDGLTYELFSHSDQISVEQLIEIALSTLK